MTSHSFNYRLTCTEPTVKHSNHFGKSRMKGTQTVDLLFLG